jgi:16S rRNA (cytosine967-C5)-methyltransferase
MTRHRHVKEPAPTRLRSRPIREDLVRAAILEVYGAIRAEGRLADRALDAVLRRETRLYANERRAVAETVYGLLRRQMLIDRALSGSMGSRFTRLSQTAADSLRLAAFRVLEGEDAHAVGRIFGLTPELAAALPSVAHATEMLQSLPPAERIAVAASLAPWLVERLVVEVGAVEAEALARALNERAPLTVRANTLRTERPALQARLADEGISARETPYSSLGLILDGHRNVFTLESFREGWFEVQDEGSQLVAEMLGAHPGECVIDACAGAGGKSLALGAVMKNRGRLVALDASGERLGELRKRARRAGVQNIEARAIAPDAAAVEQLADLRGKAHRVLVDAPCSGIGALRRNPDARYRLKPEDIPNFAARQFELLQRFSELLRPGGLVVYATCSVLRDENEAVSDRFQAQHPDFARVPISDRLGIDRAQALGAGDSLRLWPHKHGTDGFYAVALRRVSS